MVKLAHIVAITPRRCGLYETTRELVSAERELGIDARMFDSRAPEKQTAHPGGTEDRGAIFCDIDWAKQADVLVNHSGLGTELEKNCTVPVLHFSHGRPLSSFLAEYNKQAPVYAFHYGKNKDPRYKACLTFWPEHVPYLEVMWPDTPVYCIKAPVDLVRWTPDGPSGYKWHGMGGEVNVVIADANRDDVNAFTAVNAFSLFARDWPGAKLHMYAFPKGKRAWPALLKAVQDQGNLGELKPWISSGLDNVYRAADMLITPHKIYTRTIREAMACDCAVVSGHDGDTDDIVDFARRMGQLVSHPEQPGTWRKVAENLFDPLDSAREFLEIVNGCR